MRDWKVLLLEAGGREPNLADVPLFLPFTEQAHLNWHTMRVFRIADFMVASPLLSRLARDRVGAASKIKCPTAGGTGTSSKCGKYQGVLHRDAVSCFYTSSSFSFVSRSSTSSVSSSNPPSPAVLIPYIFYCSSSCLSFSCSLPHSFVFCPPL